MGDLGGQVGGVGGMVAEGLEPASDLGRAHPQLYRGVHHMAEEHRL
jgi:hypothetical protein